MSANNITVIDSNNSFQDLITIVAQLATYSNDKSVSVDEQIPTGNAVVNGSIQAINFFANTISGGVIGNTAAITFSTNSVFSGIVTINANTTANNLTVTGNTTANNIEATANVSSLNLSSNNVIITHTLASNNSHTVFYSSTGNTVFKNDAAGFRTSLDVHSKAEANTIIDNKTAEVDASAIAYAIALG